jgi:hemin uptake protein HemP
MFVTPDDHPGTASVPDDVRLSRQRAGAVEIDSGQLLQGRREVLIRHGGECYRLRHTRNDKLILTK